MPGVACPSSRRGSPVRATAGGGRLRLPLPQAAEVADLSHGTWWPLREHLECVVSGLGLPSSYRPVRASWRRSSRHWELVAPCHPDPAVGTAPTLRVLLGRAPADTQGEYARTDHAGRFPEAQLPTVARLLLSRDLLSLRGRALRARLAVVRLIASGDELPVPCGRHLTPEDVTRLLGRLDGPSARIIETGQWAQWLRSSHRPLRLAALAAVAHRTTEASATAPRPPRLRYLEG